MLSQPALSQPNRLLREAVTAPGRVDLTGGIEENSFTVSRRQEQQRRDELRGYWGCSLSVRGRGEGGESQGGRVKK